MERTIESLFREVPVGDAGRVGAGPDDMDAPGTDSTMIGCHSSMRAPQNNGGGDGLLGILDHPGNNTVMSAAIGAGVGGLLTSGLNPAVAGVSGGIAASAACLSCHGPFNGG